MMKKDLFTSILVAILGIFISYLVCNTFYGEIPPYQFNSIQETVSADLAEPDSGIFNYRAINPTVEVYVGDCDVNSNDEKCINNESDEGQIDKSVINGGSDSKPDNSENSSTEQKDQ